MKFIAVLLILLLFTQHGVVLSSSLESEMTSLKEVLCQMRAELDWTKQQFTQLTNSTSDELSSIKSELTRTTDDLRRTKDELEASKTELSTIKAEVKEEDATLKVAFTVCANAIRPYNRGDKVIYDMAITNYGEHYNLGNNSFRCPHHGIYEFAMHILSGHGFPFDSRIMKNSDDFRDGYTEAYTNDRSTWHQASNSVLLECQSGDVIWVVATENNSKLYGATHSGGNQRGEVNRCISSFSGKLVYTL